MIIALMIIILVVSYMRRNKFCFLLQSTGCKKMLDLCHSTCLERLMLFNINKFNLNILAIIVSV